MRFTKSNLTTAISFAALLTACGGGGGGSNGGSTPQTPTALDVANYATTGYATVTTVATTTTTTQSPTPTIVTSVPAPSYATDSEELAAFNLLNKERASCGFGLLAQNTKLDQATKNHANYLIINNEWAHTENIGEIGFTGLTTFDRLKTVGYDAISEFSYASSGESSSPVSSDFGSVMVLTGTGVKSTRGLLSAAYHLNGMFRGFIDVGITMTLASSVKPGKQYVAAIFNFATPLGSSAQLPNQSDVLTYPCQDSSEIPYKVMRGELPSPVPSTRNTYTEPLGQPILVHVRYGNTLEITFASLIKVSTGESIALRPPYTKSTDTVNSAYLLSNEGFILPDVAQEPNTQYKATIIGTNNGVPFKKVFTYTTGSIVT